MEPVDGRRPDDRFVRIGAAIVGGLVLVSIVMVAYDLRPGGALNPTTVQLTTVIWSSDSSVLSSGPGFDTHGGAQFTLVLVETNDAPGSIQYTSASLTPTTFRVISVSLPTIAPGASENLTVTVVSPGVDYAGPLTVALI